MRKMVLLAAVVVMVVSVAVGLCLAADEAAAAKPAKRVAVLDTYGVWRIHQTLKPPVIDFEGGPKPVVTPLDWLNRETAGPPADWTNPEFDDSTWLRGSARAFARTSYLSRLCLRGRFEVTDPAKVEGLVLRLSYYGGAIVYVNGKELARGHLAKRGKAELAEGYPTEAFVLDNGEIAPSGWVVKRYKKVLAARERTLAEVAIPAKLLRKGVNVVAIEIVRAPYHKIIGEKKVPLVDPRTRVNRGIPYHLSWNTCEMRKVRLEAGDVGLVPNASRPKGLQVWNSDCGTSGAPAATCN